jgi:uracil phosphoribosyltransferase
MGRPKRQETSMSQVVVLNHPLSAHHLSRLRDRQTSPAEFRASVCRVTYLLVVEATRDLDTDPHQVHTPLAPMTGVRLRGRIGVVPILRAGMGMLEPVLELIPDAEVWHVGVYRDERTLQPIQYYRKIPGGGPPDLAMIVDPMLATGGSAHWAITTLKEWGVKRIKLVSMVAVPEGIELIGRRHPEVGMVVGVIDQGLNDRGYIMPGLGDAGDRIYNTPDAAPRQGE